MRSPSHRAFARPCLPGSVGKERGGTKGEWDLRRKLVPGTISSQSPERREDVAAIMAPLRIHAISASWETRTCRHSPTLCSDIGVGSIQALFSSQKASETKIYVLKHRIVIFVIQSYVLE